MSTPQELPVTTVVAETPPLLRLAPVADPSPAGLPLDDIDFDDFVRRHGMRLRSLVLRRIGDASDAEEITQETLLRAYTHRHSFTVENELIAWSTVVAQRLVIDRLRVRGRFVAVAEVPEAARLGRDTADIVVARQEARTALDALEAIPSRQAAILWAREVEGLHYEEIAERFDISEPAVRSLLHRGRRALRKEYTSRGGSLPMNGLIPFAPWLLALHAAGRLRGAARRALPNNAAASALSLASVAILGVGTILGGGAPAPSIRSLPPTTTFSTNAPSADASTVVTAGAAARERVTSVTPSRPGALGSVPRSCVGGACVYGQPNFTGQTLWLGPALPENPTEVRRVGLSGVPLNLCEQTTSLAMPALADCTSPDGQGEGPRGIPSVDGDGQ